MESEFRRLWTENGDHLSVMYAGSRYVTSIYWVNIFYFTMLHYFTHSIIMYYRVEAVAPIAEQIRNPLYPT